MFKIRHRYKLSSFLSNRLDLIRNLILPYPTLLIYYFYTRYSVYLFFVFYNKYYLFRNLNRHYSLCYRNEETSFGDQHGKQCWEITKIIHLLSCSDKLFTSWSIPLWVELNMFEKSQTQHFCQINKIFYSYNLFIFKKFSCDLKMKTCAALLWLNHTMAMAVKARIT